MNNADVSHSQDNLRIQEEKSALVQSDPSRNLNQCSTSKIETILEETVSNLERDEQEERRVLERIDNFNGDERSKVAVFR